MENSAVAQVLAATVCQGATKEEVVAFAIVANEHHLNPFKKEIYALPKKGGGLVPMVPIDGWTNIVNRHPSFDGCDFEEHEDSNGKVEAITCTIHVKGRSHPIVIKERLVECYRKTTPWETMPMRMLRHKAFMQCARVAFSLGGIFDEDESKDQVNRAEGELAPPRKIDVTVIDAKTGEVSPETPPPNVDLISESQRRRMFVIAHQHGIKDEDLKTHLHDNYGIDSSKHIPVAVYEEIIEWAAKPPVQTQA